MAATHRFSPLDEIMPPIFNALIVGFPCAGNNRDALFSLLQRSLALLVEDMPCLAGEIVQKDCSMGRYQRVEPEIEGYADNTAPPLAFRDLTDLPSPIPYTYHQLHAEGFPPSKLDGSVLAPMAGVATTRRVMAAQANFLDGGCLLSVGFSHLFTDAYGAYLVMEKWAQYCRQLQRLPKQPPAFPTAAMDENHRAEGLPASLQVRSKSQMQYDELKQRPELWRLIGLDWRGSKATLRAAPPPFQPQGGVTDIRIFSLSADAIAELKEKAKAGTTTDGTELTLISSNDAMVAFLWRSITEARFPTWQPSPPHRESSYVSVAIDGRNALHISPDYIGNVVFCSMTEMPIACLSDRNTSLSSIASRIRTETVANRDPRRLRDAVTLAAGIPDVRHLANAFPSWFAEDLVTTSWVGLPFYKLDFGPAFGKSGRIDTFRMPRDQFGGICSFQPRDADGSVEVVVGLLPEQMERLVADAEFRRYATFVAR